MYSLLNLEGRGEKQSHKDDLAAPDTHICAIFQMHLLPLNDYRYQKITTVSHTFPHSRCDFTELKSETTNYPFGRCNNSITRFLHTLVISLNKTTEQQTFNFNFTWLCTSSPSHYYHPPQNVLWDLFRITV